MTLKDLELKVYVKYLLMNIVRLKEKIVKAFFFEEI